MIEARLLSVAAAAVLSAARGRRACAPGQASGVERSETFAARIATRLAEDRQQVVRLTDLGIQGVGTCDIVGDLHNRLDRGQPDALVIEMFADDLEQRGLTSVGGRVVGLAGRSGSPAVGWLASRSYLATG